MSERFLIADRETPLLLPPDRREWVPDNDMAHFVIEASKRSAVPLQMMLTLLIYCYSNGIFGSRRIERATYRDVAVRYITADSHPDHDTIAAFRRTTTRHSLNASSVSLSWRRK